MTKTEHWMRVQTSDEEFLDAVQKPLRAMFVSFPSKRFSLGVLVVFL